MGATTRDDMKDYRRIWKRRHFLVNYFNASSGLALKTGMEEKEVYTDSLKNEIHVPAGTKPRTFYYNKVKQFMQYEKLSMNDKKDMLTAIYIHDV
jgi:hypothetical protein